MDLRERIQDLEERLNVYRRITKQDKFAFGEKNSKTVSVKELEKDLSYFKRAVELREDKKTYRQIGESMGFQNTSILKWLTKGVLPGKLHVLYRINKAPRNHSPEIAYILGAYTAAHNVDSKWHVIWFNYRNNDILKKLKSCFEKAWPRQYRKFRNGGLAIGSRDIVRHIYHITRHNNSIPWEHIGTREEKLEYLRGLFDLRGTPIKIGGFSFQLTKTSRRLLQELRVLLADFGILATLKKTTGKYCLTLYDSELKKLIDLGVLPQSKLDKLAGFNAEPNDFVRMYYTAWLLKEDYTAKEIANSIGATKRIVIGWLKPGRNKKNKIPEKNSLPKIIKRHKEIENFKNIYLFDPDAASMLYRNGSIESEKAREIASVFDIDDVLYVFPKGEIPHSANEITEPLLYIIKEEIRDHREISSFVTQDINGKLYDKITKINEMFNNETRTCKYFAQTLSEESGIPFTLLLEWLTEKKPLNAENLSLKR